jgi:hypothetical protein
VSDTTPTACPVGSAIDATGLVMNREDGEILEHVIVIARVITPEGGTAIRVASTPGLDWMLRRGIFELAHDQEMFTGRDDAEGDD